MKYVCDICTHLIEPDELYSDESGEYHTKCIEEYHREAAVTAGIPRSVVEGRTRLSDHFSESYINWKCNRPDSKGDV